MTTTDAGGWQPVATALLGSWPSQVASWGREALAAYVAEISARGITPDQALNAIRMWPAGSDFPPSAPNLAAAARRDPSKPTFDEAVTLIFGRGGVLRARTPVRKASWEFGERDRLDAEAMLQRAGTMHPLIGAFIRAQGLERLRDLDLEDPQWGGARRANLRDDWQEFAEAHEGREVAALLAPRRGELDSFDPLAALDVPRRMLAPRSGDPA